jgi:hypothetical protein
MRYEFLPSLFVPSGLLACPASKGRTEMAKTVADLLASASHEWEHWGQSTWNLSNNAQDIAHTDDEEVFAQYVIDNYCSVGGGSPSVIDISNDHYFWSAVGMSAIFAAAGFVKTEFPFAQAHSKWIKKFVKARKNNIPALYHGFRLNEAQASPQVGDMVGYTYANVTFEQAQAYFDKTGSYPSHTDVVVERRPFEIDVIGANVLDSVTKKTIPLTAAGLIADRSHKWFVVLKRLRF